MRLYSIMKLFFILLFFTALRVDAGIYKWIDEAGSVHYGDKPVAQTNATELIINTDANTGITNSSGNNKERDRMTQELQEDRKLREKAREDKRLEQHERQKRCASFKQQLLWHQRANAVYKKDANGERVYLSQAERDATVKKINQGIDKNCR